jgi:hypothetical protein
MQPLTKLINPIREKYLPPLINSNAEPHDSPDKREVRDLLLKELNKAQDEGLENSQDNIRDI